MRRLLLACVVLMSAAVGFAQDARPTTVVMKDNTQLRGTVSDATPAGFKLTPTPKPARPNGPPPETPAPQDVKWADVKQVGGGLTRAKIVAEWRATRAAELCATCRGAGVGACAACKGTRASAEAVAACVTCAGAGTADCPKPACEDGKTRCPAPCFKADDPGWSAPDADGKRWRTVRGPGGASGRISDGHVGEVINRQTMQPEKCASCTGTGKADCETCGADGKVPCKACAAKAAAAPCAACKDGTEACAPCAGSGMATTG